MYLNKFLLTGWYIKCVGIHLTLFSFFQPIPTKKPKAVAKETAPEVAPVTTIKASGTVAVEDAPQLQEEESAPAAAVATSSDQGPRQAGARRSRERQRGKKRKSSKE